MKTQKFFLVTILVLTTGLTAFSQKKSNVNVSEFFNAGKLPQSLELKDELQKYVVTTDHFNTDIFGNFFNKIRIKGDYTRGLPDEQFGQGRAGKSDNLNKLTPVLHQLHQMLLQYQKPKFPVKLPFLNNLIVASNGSFKVDFTLPVVVILH